MNSTWRPWSIEEYEARLAILWHMAAIGAIRCKALGISRTDASEMVAFAREIADHEPIATDETYDCWDGWRAVFGYRSHDKPPEHFEADADQFDFVHGVIRKLLDAISIPDHETGFVPRYFAREQLDQHYALSREWTLRQA